MRTWGLVLVLLATLPAPGEAAAKRRPKKAKVHKVEKAPPSRARSETLLRVEVLPEVSGATVLLDGQKLGAARAEPFPVSPGEHKLTVSRAGYLSFWGLVQVVEGQTTTVRAELQPEKGVLSVTSQPKGAELFVDGQPWGKAPLKSVEILPGAHEVRATKAGYEETRQTFEVGPGEDRTLRLELVALAKTKDRPERNRLDTLENDPDMLMETRVAPQEEPPWYRRWYVWAGVGAAATFVVVTALVASSSADLSEKKLCKGACDIVVR